MGVWDFIYSILAFPGTLTVVTTIAAFVVWMLYNKQRHDQRRDAAKIILSEIEQAEDRIPELKKTLKQLDENGMPDSMRLMKVDNWDSAQYLLTGQLPDDVIDTINAFYTYCRLIDEALSFLDSAFSKNEAAVRENAFRVNADYQVALINQLEPNPQNKQDIKAKNDKISGELHAKREAFNESFPTLYTYQPVKPTNDIKKYLDLLPTALSQGRVGDKLRLAKLGRIKRVLAGQWVQP